MPSCHEMKKGEVYVCGDCGLELQVVKECTDSDTAAEACGCQASPDPCTLACCGMELVKKA